MSQHHILTIDDPRGQRPIILEAATYSIGRDHSNAIVLEGHTLSRQHAVLLRLPLGGGSYRYRLIDGNVAGKLSTNGIRVNGQRCTSWDLQNGDQILFGEEVKAMYQVLSPEASAQLLSYLKIDPAAVQNPQSGSVNGKETLHSQPLPPRPGSTGQTFALPEEDEEDCLTQLHPQSQNSRPRR
uniref:FHA domain containing protein n=1 Tax=Cyanothece sp. (strain PCC 7425 / ATCC 29141) TaxID=395961 RepID=B8HXI6_CYAP4